MENRNKLGIIEITNNAFKDIVKTAISRFDEIEPSKKENAYVDINNKNNEFKILIHIKVKQGIDVSKVSKALQEEVHDSIETMTGIDVKTINLSIDGFIA